MKEIRTCFEQDKSLPHIDVLVRASERDEEVETLLARVSEKPPALLTVTDASGVLRRLNFEDVIMISVNGRETRLVTEKDSFTIQQALKSVEPLLDKQKFVRVSRFEIVNVTRIQKYDFTLSGTLRLELAGGIETWASRRSIPVIRRLLNGKEAERSC